MNKPRPANAPFWGRRLRGTSALAWAPAKVNLHLEVLGKRPDGYHDIATIMLAIDLMDLMEVYVLEDNAFGLECTDPTLSTGLDNLILKAAITLAVRTQTPHGAFIRLMKRIPTQAGMGGGSSDAATTLLCLNELWQTGLSLAELSEVAAEVGSDVAFFLTPPAGWCEGRGEIVTPQRIGETLDLVIVKPPVGCPTAAVYQGVTVPKSPVDATAIRGALKLGDAEAIGRHLFNRLQKPAERIAPEIAAVTQCLAGLGPAGVLMSGSGSAVFAICRSRREAVRIADEVREAAPAGVEPGQVFVARSWPNEENAEFGMQNSE